MAAAVISRGRGPGPRSNAQQFFKQGAPKKKQIESDVYLADGDGSPSLERSALTMEPVVRSVRLGAARKHTAAQRHASSSSGLLYQMAGR
jgi:hypothetical protein